MNDKKEYSNKTLLKNLTLDDLYTDYYMHYSVTALSNMVSQSDPRHKFLEKYNCSYEEWLDTIAAVIEQKILDAIEDKRNAHRDYQDSQPTRRFSL